ncbi:MAG: hypothetical protein GY849_02265 [Deltaproteobacteria bacterium]|nr:hypothetical protein [Deltaproteobacteria bacterium]
MTNKTPIKLTKYNIQKLGFKYIKGYDAIFEKCKLSGFEEIFYIDGLFFLENESFDDFSFHYATSEDEEMMLCQLKYVHELQDLYFGLTRKKLNLNNEQKILTNEFQQFAWFSLTENQKHWINNKYNIYQAQQIGELNYVEKAEELCLSSDRVRKIATLELEFTSQIT